ncbi:endonuclease III [Candidatus Bathyarchaeota archaeon]|nr:endonuclease III [Candidatus Bathyarchaeota archaeon]
MSRQNENETFLRAKEILKILKNNFSIPEISDISKNPFEVLVRTVISQSTAEVNTRRAFQNLLTKMPITPENLAQASIRDIEEALRVAGLYKNKSIILKKISSIIIERFNGDLNFIYTLPLNKARERLLSLPGVGPKTADIVLLFCARKPVLPIDTHVNRVSKRLGLVPEEEKKYDAIRKRLEKLYAPEEYFDVHMLFIALGRKFCKSLKPLCSKCPLDKFCPSAEF